MVMPKPELMPLTGGYRKTPVLQIGADIYCDTRLIARELERRFPSLPSFPDGNRGMALALSHWSDTALFEPGAGLSMAMTTQVPEEVLADRREFFTFMDFSSARRRGAPPVDAAARQCAPDRGAARGRAFLPSGRGLRVGGHHQLLPPLDGTHFSCRRPRACSCPMRACTPGRRGCAPSGTASGGHRGHRRPRDRPQRDTEEAAAWIATTRWACPTVIR